MKIQDLQSEIIDIAKSMGEKDGQFEPKARKGFNAIIRSNLKSDNGSPYFGFIRADEEQSGPYADFSLVVFPDFDDDGVRSFVVSLVVGTQGFKNDYDVALQPGWRRQFMKLKSDNTFFKTDFSDTTTTLQPLMESEMLSDALRASLDKYRNVIVAACVIHTEPEEENPDESRAAQVRAWIATYAKLRGWATNNKDKITVERMLPKAEAYDECAEMSRISALLDRHRYVILQGAPGCGKTYATARLAREWEEANGPDSTFFIQFHAETTYADFIWGIEPDYSGANSLTLTFKEKKGILLKAIDAANSRKDRKILLIIDEINRANLPNVLGPVFYLFEKGAREARVALSLGTDSNGHERKLDRLPDNLFVLGTMNTADRSLAVVDFALRRRFLWYTMRPHVLAADDFNREAFEAMERIFMQHATDEELSLQPGHSYFLTGDMTFEERAKYELLPLIKEYLAEGRLETAKDAFSKYFDTYAHTALFE